MSDFLNVILVSFSQLLFSSPALGIMANKASCKAIHFSRSGLGPENEPACHRGARPEAPGVSHMFIEPVRISDISLPVHGINKIIQVNETQNESPTLVPCNSPVITPSQSLIRALCESRTLVDLARDSVAAIDSFSTSASFFDVSLISDNSEEDSQSERSLDTLFCSFPVPQRSSVPASARGSGLGISGVYKKDGTTPFDGTGIVSSSWRRSRHTRDHAHDSFEEFSRHLSTPGYESDGYPLVSDDSSGSLSRVFLQEAFITFTEDPFHTCALDVIPECRSWYELDNAVSRTLSPVHFDPSLACEAPLPNFQPAGEVRRLRLKKTFSSPTISSELKRSSSVPLKRVPSTRPRFGSASSSPPSGCGIKVAPALNSMKNSLRREWRM